MTAIRDRQSDPDADDVPVPWDERPVVGSRRGLPWWAAVLVGLGLAVAGALLGKPSQANIPVIFVVCYIAGAVIAVCVVKRRGLFGPMVMPPLVLAVTVPTVILLTSGSQSQGDDMLSKALSIGTPLINSFPMMAITTGITLLIGIVRIVRERDPDAPKKLKKTSEDDEKPRAAARPRPAGSNRTGQTPLPSGARRGRDGEPPRRPRPPADGERRSPRAGAPAERDSGTRGTRKPPPATRRTPRPDDGDPRRREPRGDAPRRRPRPPAEDGRDTPPPRRPSGGRTAPPRRNRPWDDEER